MVHWFPQKGRPFTDYVIACDMDEVKGLSVGSQYRNDICAAEFAHRTAEAERLHIQNSMSDVKFVPTICDGTTDSSFQEAEIVYVHTSLRTSIR